MSAIEFKGKFLQGHYIIGITDPNAKIIVGKKKEVKVSNDGFFVFGIDRDRKFDITITKIINGQKKIIRGFRDSKNRWIVNNSSRVGLQKNNNKIGH